MHPNGVSDNVGNHPNAFFNSSVDYIKSIEKKKGKQGSNVGTTAIPEATQAQGTEEEVSL